MHNRRSLSDFKNAREALKFRQEQAAAKWYFAASGVTDTQLMAAGVFTGDARHSFYSRRSIASFRGKLLHLRDVCTPGRRIGSISVLIIGESVAVTLSLENLEKEFRERVVFRKKSVYQVFLTAEAMSHEETIEVDE